MTIKDLLVHLGGRPDVSDARLEAALGVADAFRARVVALCLVMEPHIPSAIGAEFPPELLREQRAAAEAAADGILTAAAARAERAGVALEGRRETAPPVRLPELVARQARYADLVIVGQPDPDDPDDLGPALPEAAFMASGRPALVVPYIGAPPMPPRRVLAAWDGSREAARALHDALPFLTRATGGVSVVTVGPEDLAERVGEQPARDLGAHLARHDVRAELASLPGAGLAVADVLLNRAADAGAELIVMGGYGHARLREVVLGGVTRQMLRQMTVPVLFSH
ncbi:MAG TPA: universal stress protein [Geminicoccaceae bacterium]|nr:universal stress protein [Geminicoccaceae bacterium]